MLLLINIAVPLFLRLHFLSFFSILIHFASGDFLLVFTIAINILISKTNEGGLVMTLFISRIVYVFRHYILVWYEICVYNKIACAPHCTDTRTLIDIISVHCWSIIPYSVVNGLYVHTVNSMMVHTTTTTKQRANAWITLKLNNDLKKFFFFFFAHSIKTIHK